MSTTTEQPTLDEIIKAAEQDYAAQLESENVTTAKGADELAGDVATTHAQRYEFEDESDEFDAIQSALFKIAGEKFPGNWEDYTAQ